MNKILKFSLGALLLLFLSLTVSTRPIFATNISRGDMKRVGHFALKNRQPQGCAITKKYYVFTDSQSGGGSNGLTTIRFIDRSTGKEVATNNNLKNKDFEHASTLYNEWGSDYLQIIDANSGKMWCADISDKPKLVSSSKCGKRLSSGGLDKGNTQYYRQGWTKYGDVYLRAYSGDYNDNNRIELYVNQEWKKNYDFPIEKPECELEDVAVDGSTGDVYAMCWNHSSSTRYVDFYRIKASIFSKYIKSSGGSSSDDYNGPTTLPGDFNSNTTDSPTDFVGPEHDGIVNTTFFGTIQEDGEGCGVYTVLSLVMTIMTIGIGITAVIGITIAGIIYLTAGGNVAKTTIAKRRIYEIIIGLAAYAALAAILAFLLPEFNPELKTCQQATPEAIAKHNAERQSFMQSSQESTTETSSQKNTKKTTKKLTDEQANWAAAQAISDKAVELAKNSHGGSVATEAWKKAWTKYAKASDTGDSCHRDYGKSCGSFVSTVLAAAGVDTKNIKDENYADSILSYMKGGNDPWLTIKSPSTGWKKGYKARRGDVAIKQYCDDGCHWHVYVYLNYTTKQGQKYTTAEASHCQHWGKLSNNSNPDYVFRYNGGNKYYKAN